MQEKKSKPYRVRVEYRKADGNISEYTKTVVASTPATAYSRVLKFAPKVVSENYIDCIVEDAES